MSTIFRRAMSTFTIANLPRVEVATLSEQLLTVKTPESDKSIAVIDVRDGGRFCRSFRSLSLLHYASS